MIQNQGCRDLCAALRHLFRGRRSLFDPLQCAVERSVIEVTIRYKDLFAIAFNGVDQNGVFKKVFPIGMNDRFVAGDALGYDTEARFCDDDIARRKDVDKRSR